MKKFFVVTFLIMLSGVLFAETVAKQNKDNQMNIQIGKETFNIILENNKTVKSLCKKLPMTLKMADLNNNEKYSYLDFTLPTDAKNVKNIKKGDVMLFGSSCLVIFYKSFSTSYSYTKIGHIENPGKIEKVLGNSTIEVIFKK
jgi:hypothetical protein